MTILQLLHSKRHLSLKNQGINTYHLIEWCDGAGSQYKLVYAFQDLVNASPELGCLVTRCFFETEHGKGESVKRVV